MLSKFCRSILAASGERLFTDAACSSGTLVSRAPEERHGRDLSETDWVMW